MNTLLNIVWFILGGWLAMLIYVFSSIMLMVTIVGIPFGFQTLKLALVVAAPFGTVIGEGDSTTGCLSLIMNIIWILIGGFWIAIVHACLGVLFSITVIGIPLGLQHFKMAVLALLPFGKTVN